MQTRAQCSVFSVQYSSPRGFNDRRARLRGTVPAGISRITHHESSTTFHVSRFRHAFTLIEIMIVVGIMGLVLTMSIPFAKKAMHREELTQSVLDVQAVCAEARKKAIFQGSMADLVFHAREGSMNVGSAGEAKPQGIDAGSIVATGGPPPANQSAHFSDQVVIEVLKVNGVDCMEMDSARVRFFPNGTCDDMTMVLSRADRRESTEIILEPTTGHTFIESDRSKFRSKF